MNYTINTIGNYLSKNPNAYWEGWDLVIFTPDAKAWSNVRGVFDRANQAWGFVQRIKPNKHGKWIIPDKARNGRG
jgi:hypothetical protein